MSKSSGISLASMILGIIGVVFSFIGIFVATLVLDIISLVASVIAVAMAGKCLHDGEKNGYSITGLITSIIAIVISVICLIIVAAGIALIF